MNSENYYIQDVTYGEGETAYTAKTVSMGDGLTGVNTLLWPDSVGILFHRSDFVEAFKREVFTEENPCKPFQGELVAITFDNIKSIDAVIGQLQECRDNLLKIK